MSVLIKGMKIPKNCEQCWFYGSDSAKIGYCYLLKGKLPMPDGVPQDCPLIEIPPHGDLIDMDVLKEWVENWFRMDRNYHPYAKSNNIPITELYDILERMPTIIPASCENPAKSRDNHEIDEAEEGRLEWLREEKE